MDSPLAIAFLDINPAADGHTLVAPRDHFEDIFALHGEVATGVWALTLDAARRLDAVLKPDGMTIFQANREAGWQDVFHFHIHLVPRWNGDPLVRPWRVASGDPQRLDDLAERLRDE
jgi:histidine triad (HIT) family protein